MFAKYQTRNKLQKEIDKALVTLAQSTNAQEYTNLVDRISRLQKLKAEQAPRTPSPDTMLIVGANLLGILWLTTYERDNPITSKAMNLIMKPK